MRLQPEETIYWKVQNKVPGLGFETNQIRMDLLYATKFQQRKLPEARAAAVFPSCKKSLFFTSGRRLLK